MWSRDRVRIALERHRLEVKSLALLERLVLTHSGSSGGLLWGAAHRHLGQLWRVALSDTL